MAERPNILIVCGRNKKRSRTAEYIFKNDSRFNIRSAGVSPSSNRKISENDLNWADLIFVMETEHRAKILGLYKHLVLPAIEILNMPPALVLPALPKQGETGSIHQRLCS